MAAMIAAARRPLPLPEMGAPAFALAVPVVKVPLEVVDVVALVAEEDWTSAAVVAGIVLATLFGISKPGSRQHRR